MAASLVGAIVGELPTGAVAGLGRAPAGRLLLQPDHPDLVGAVRRLDLAALLVIAVGLVERLVALRMGARPA